MILKVLFLLIGVAACATAVIVIKLSKMDTCLIASYRQLAAALILLPLFIRDARRVGTSATRRTVSHALLPGLFLGLHFMLWINGARLTPVANSSLLVNISPVAMPFLIFFLAHEKINRWELAGTTVALAGLILMVGRDFHLSETSFMGDLLCFASMVMLTAYLALAKRHRNTGSFWLYIVPIYTIGGLTCLIPATFRTSLFHHPPEEWLYALYLAAVPTVVGHSIMNFSMRQLRGQIVSIVNLSQFLMSAILGFLILKEIPDIMFLPASILIVAGALITILNTPALQEQLLSPDSNKTNSH